MKSKIAQTEVAYKVALKRTLQIVQSECGTIESDELELLLVLVKNYEDNYIVWALINLTAIIKENLQHTYCNRLATLH